MDSIDENVKEDFIRGSINTADIQDESDPAGASQSLTTTLKKGASLHIAESTLDQSQINNDQMILVKDSAETPDYSAK